MEIETLKAIYEEKQAKYKSLCDALDAANEAQRRIRELCDAAMADMHKAGEELIGAMKQ